VTKRKRWLTMAAAGVAAIVVSGAPAWGGEISGTVGIDSAATASAGAVRVRSGVPAFTAFGGVGAGSPVREGGEVEPPRTAAGGTLSGPGAALTALALTEQS
jgi:hypothetical protein